MTRTAPVVIAAVVGFLMVIAYFSPPLLPWRQSAEDWYAILAAIAMVLGGTNLCFHHLKKVSQREAGWGFSLVTVVTFTITVFVGLFKVGVVPESVSQLNYRWTGQFLQEGSALWWMYQYLFSPIVSTMFALLAFYVASAAFRAFRAKNVEAVLLLVTALIILVGQTRDRELTSLFIAAPPDTSIPYPIAVLSEFIRSTFVTAGQRAIMIGIAFGVVATSLRILLGRDRSYLGGDD